MRADEGIEKVLIPGITVLRREFEEAGQFIRLCITVIAKEETDTQIHAGQNEKPLPFRYQLFAHGFCGDEVGSVTAGLGFNSHSTLMIFHSPFELISYLIFALAVSCGENGDDIGPVQFSVRAEKRCASN